MSGFDRLTAAQMREAAEVLRAWAAERQHDAQVAAEVLDQASIEEATAAVQRVEAVQDALLAEAIRQEREVVAQVGAATR
jgi:hypothetical protein